MVFVIYRFKRGKYQIDGIEKTDNDDDDDNVLGGKVRMNSLKVQRLYFALTQRNYAGIT